MNECRHLAIIMDGNGRWAKKQGKPRSYGHMVGAENVRRIAIAASELNIQHLTIYAFSTENWKRSQDEVNYLMKLPSYFFDKYMKEFIDRGFRIRIIGNLDELPKATKDVLVKAMKDSEMNTGLSLNIAMNYGSRDEITRACIAYAKDVKDGKKDLDLNEETFESYLMTSFAPSVDLLIRTSGEQRLSNYLLWQLAYAEMMFVEEAWPEFTKESLQRCLQQYQNRDRRFGGVKYE